MSRSLRRKCVSELAFPPARRPASITCFVLFSAILAGCARGSNEIPAVTGHIASDGTTDRHSARARIPLPALELLERPASPNCEFKPATQSDSGARDAQRLTKLDYEQQCYRQSEAILRARLQRLQEAVGKTIDAIKRLERAPQGQDG